MKVLPKHIIVNYHYVRDPSPDWGGIWPCSPAEFERQVKFLSENYKVGGIAEVYEAAQKKSEEAVAAITFDDGTKDQILNAWPILKKYELTASFFIISGTLERILPTAHKIHVLLSKISAGDLIDLFNRFQKNLSIPKNRRINERRRLFENMEVANFKEAMIQTPKKMQDDFFGHAFSILGLDEKAISEELFMSAEDIGKLAKEGCDIGNHTHYHYLPENVNEEDFKKDLDMSQKILKDVSSALPTLFCSPHGRTNEAVIKVLREEGFKYAMSIEARPVEASDNPYFIPRLDTNDLKTLIGGFFKSV